MNNIGLAELIEQVKKDLFTQPTHEVPLFAIGSLELEITFTASRKIDGGVDLKIVTMGADKVDEQVQHIKITLEPLVTPEKQRELLGDHLVTKAAIPLRRGEEEG